MKLYKYIKPVALGLLLFSSCNDEILEKMNPTALPSEGFLNNEVQLKAAVNGAYAALQANQLYGREFFFLHDMLSDENIPNGSSLEAPRAALIAYNIDPGNSLIGAVWQGLYRVINRSNLVIANIENVPEFELAVEDRNRYEAQSRFLRAWAYFELVSLWGDVPLLTEPASTETAKSGVPRTPAETIYSQIIFPDLDFAEEWLLRKSEYAAEDLGRVPKGAAQALKGKIHLFRGEFAEARDELLKVVNSNEYRLTDEYLDNFQEENENNSESLFEVQFNAQWGNPNGNAWSPDGPGVEEITFRGQEYTPVTGWNNVFPSPGLVSSFEEGDPRYTYTFYEDGDKYFNETLEMEFEGRGFPSEAGWRKYSNAYKQQVENQNSGINFRVIRYADVLLMLAEAVNEVDGPAAAIGYVNMVRQRPSVNMPALEAPSNPEAMFDIIVLERMAELSSEQLRNRDIRRWRIHGKFSGKEDPIKEYAEKHSLLPIPANEIANNPAISQADQNPGY